MDGTYFIGLDIHKRTIAFCIKYADGRVHSEGAGAADRGSLRRWVEGLPGVWDGAMEATLFTGWVYDYLKPYARSLKVAHPEMLKAITSAKKKNDRADASMIADLVRVNLIPECYMAPTEYRDLRRILRFRNQVVRMSVMLKNRMSGLLMEVGATYSKQRLHGKRYFSELLGNLEEVPESVIDLLRMNRMGLELFVGMQKTLLNGIREQELIRARVDRLMTIPGIGEVTALTWVLEAGEIDRFPSVRKMVSYCGLCSGQHESAGKTHRGPLSKKRNGHLQTVLIEAAKLAPRWNPRLAELYAREVERGNRNRATLAVARKLVAYLLTVDKRGEPFTMAEAA
jgi:transposase